MAVAGGFPTACRRSTKDSPPSADGKKMSIFARQFLQRAEVIRGAKPEAGKDEDSSSKSDCVTGNVVEHWWPKETKDQKMQRRIPDNIDATMVVEDSVSDLNKDGIDELSKENDRKLAEMGEQEILAQQKELLKILDPSVIAFLKSRGQSKMPATENRPHTIDCNKEMPKLKESALQNTAKLPPVESSVHDLPIKPDMEWVHMDQIEHEKLAWMKDLPPPSTGDNKTGKAARFDFEGRIVAAEADVPVHLGLHHHGNEPERAGYTLEELFQLSRSVHVPQRSLALNIISEIIKKARCGEFCDCLSTSVIPSLIDAGLVFILRWALDDSIDNSVTAAIRTLHALVVTPEDEAAADKVFTWTTSCTMPSLAAINDETTSEDKDAHESDADVVKRDVIEGLLRMSILERLCYLLDKFRLQPIAVIEIMEIVIRIARHSAQSAYKVFSCSRLLDVVFKEFLPVTWSPVDVSKPLSSTYGYPLPAALKLVRVIATAGRNMAALLISKYNLLSSLLRYLSQLPSELILHAEQAHQISFEGWYTWRTLLQYGLGLDSFNDFYRIPMEWLSQWLCVSEWQSNSATSQLACAVVSVAEAVYHSAGIATARTPFNQEKDAALDASEPFVPYFNWNIFKGIHELMLACLERCLTDFTTYYFDTKYDLTFTVCCLNYFGTYYSKVDKQPDYKAVVIQQQVELLTQQLIPVLTSQAFSLTLQYVRQNSVLLYESESKGKIEVSNNLPSLGSLVGPNACQCPVLIERTTVHFSLAISRLLTTLGKLNRSVVETTYHYLLNNGETLQYLRRLCKLPTCLLAANPFASFENYFQFYLISMARIQCAGEVSSVDMTLYHILSLSLLTRLHPGDEHIAHDLFSQVIFNPVFLRDVVYVDDNLPSTHFDETLSLQENISLSSATQQLVDSTAKQLTKDLVSHLPSVRAAYLQVAPVTPVALIQSRQRFVHQSEDVNSLMSSVVGQLLVPLDWVFIPLVGLLEQAISAQSADGSQERVPPVLITLVQNALRAVYLLERWRPVSLTAVSLVVKLCRLMCSFLAGSDLFLDSTVQRYLGALLRVYCKPVNLNRMNFQQPVAGLASFYDFYMQLISQYEAVSFGDSLFGCYILLPLQQQHSIALRRAVWSEHNTVLRSLSIPIAQMLIPMSRFLEPDESDVELLKLYCRSLLSGEVSFRWSPVMYLAAVHHVNRFIYAIDSINIAVKYAMIRQINSSHDEKLRHHVIFYKRYNADCDLHMELYDTLPALRQVTLEAATDKN